MSTAPVFDASDFLLPWPVRANGGHLTHWVMIPARVPGQFALDARALCGHVPKSHPLRMDRARWIDDSSAERIGVSFLSGPSLSREPCTKCRKRLPIWYSITRADYKP